MEAKKMEVDLPIIIEQKGNPNKRRKSWEIVIFKKEICWLSKEMETKRFVKKKC